MRRILDCSGILVYYPPFNRGISMKYWLTILVSFVFLSSAVAQPRVLLYYDMEGLSGVRDWRLTSAAESQYPQGRMFLTADVNSAIRGLKDGGAGEIVVTDAHGSGSPEPDILLEEMDKRATFEFRDTAFAPYTDMPSSKYQAIVCIGMHARAFTPGFLAHTYTVEPAFNVNGLDFTETTIIAVSAARFGIPVIMVSGDDVLEKQVREQFPNTEFAVVKTARARGDADTLTQPEAQRRIYEAARSAMRKLSSIKPFHLDGPFEFAMSFQNRAQTDRAANYPGLQRRGDTTLVFSDTDFIEGYKRSLALVRLATTERTSLLFRAVREHPAAAEIMRRFNELVHERWFSTDEFWTPPTPPRKRYHGAQ